MATPSPRYRPVHGLDRILGAHEEWNRSDGRAGREADFSGAHLRNADLQSADLSGISFRQADLRGANLAGTFLIGADLSDADLRTADLTNARLARAQLTATKLAAACLHRADLSHAHLEQANLSSLSLSEILVLNRERRFEILRLAATDPSIFFCLFGDYLDTVIEVLEEHRMGSSFGTLRRTAQNARFEFLRLSTKSLYSAKNYAAMASSL